MTPRAGGWHRGESHTQAKLTETSVRAIKRQLVLGRPQDRIAKEFGISRSVVSMIATGRGWAHVTLSGDIFAE